jgi:hypothetical protein
MNVGFHTGAKIRPVGELSEAEAVIELLGCTVEQAADALRQYDEDFHPENLMRDISESLGADARVEFQERVRAAMIEQPDVPIVEHMLEAAVAIEAERD